MQESVDYLASTVGSPAHDVWAVAFPALQAFVIAVIVLIVGLIVSKTLGQLASKVVGTLGIDKAVHRLGLSHKLDDIGIEYKISAIVGWIVKWFFLIVTFMIVANQLRLDEVTDFLGEVVLYIPQVIIAVAVLAVGLLVAQFVRGIVEKAVENTNLAASAKKACVVIPQYAITLFAFFAALTHLGIAAELIQTLFTGIIFAVSLALGLAFGLGGKEHASRFLDSLKK